MSIIHDNGKSYDVCIDTPLLKGKVENASCGNAVHKALEGGAIPCCNRDKLETAKKRN